MKIIRCTEMGPTKFLISENRRVTTWLQSEIACDGWYAWMITTGLKAAVVKNPITNLFAVYRDPPANPAFADEDGEVAHRSGIRVN